MSATAPRLITPEILSGLANLELLARTVVDGFLGRLATHDDFTAEDVKANWEHIKKPDTASLPRYSPDN